MTGISVSMEGDYIQRLIICLHVGCHPLCLCCVKLFDETLDSYQLSVSVWCLCAVWHLQKELLGVSCPGSLLEGFPRVSV